MQKFFENGKTQNITTAYARGQRKRRSRVFYLRTLKVASSLINQRTGLKLLQSPEEKILSAIDSFHPWKAAGFDKIFPALIQKSKSVLVPFLVPLFRSCHLHSYIPACWRSTLVKFIPKPGKNPNMPKAYRPICLTSFLLKTLEKLIDNKIRNVDLELINLKNSQHAYRPGRGTESALHDFPTFTDSSFSNNLINLSFFVDINGAFRVSARPGPEPDGL